MGNNNPTKIISRLVTALLAFAYVCNTLIARRYYNMVKTRESRQLMQAVGMACTVLAFDQIAILLLNGGTGKHAGLANVGRLLLAGAIYYTSYRFWSSFIDDSHGGITHGSTQIKDKPT